MKLQWLVTLGFLCALVIGACSRGSSQPSQATDSSAGAGTPAQAGATSGGTTPAAAGGPALTIDEATKLIRAWADAKSYRMVVTATSSDPSKNLTMTVDVIQANGVVTRQHSVITAGGQTVETILIDTTLYTKIGNTWQKSTTTVPASSFGLDPKRTEEQIKDALAKNPITKGGQSTVDGRACQEWMITGPSDTVVMCVDNGTALPLQVTTRSSGVTIKFTNWNVPVSIEPPI